MKKVQVFIFVLMAIFFLGSFSSVLAQDPAGGITSPGRSTTDPGRLDTDPGVSAPSSPSTAVQNPLVANSITELFQAIIDIVMIFAIPIIVFFIVYAGFLYVTARGSTETIQKAHRALLYAIIGALLIIGANVLIDVVGGTVQSITN